MISFAGTVGRLVEIRFVPPISEDDVDRFVVASQLHAARIGVRRVACVDMLRLNVLSPVVAERVAEMLRDRGPTVERTACLLPREAATLALQIERLHRNAGNPGRRAFRRADDAERFLGEVLNDAERARLKEFLDGIGARSAA